MIDLTQLLLPIAAGLCIAVVAPTIGMFTVLRRYSLVADSLAHVVLLGVVIGSVSGLLPGVFPFVVAVLAALLVEYLREYRQVSGEAALAVIMTGGVAAASTLASMFGKPIDEEILFGSLEMITRSGLVTILVVGLVVMVFVLLLWKELVYASFDDEAARAQGLPVRSINMILMVMTALTATAVMQVVGVLLTGALTVVPVIAAIQLRRGFRTTAAVAIIISVTATTAGLVLSSVFRLAPGGVIVLAALALLFLIMLMRRLFRT